MKYYIDFIPMSKNKLSEIKSKFPDDFPPSRVDRTYFKQAASVVKMANLNHALYDADTNAVSDFELRSRQKGYTREQASQDLYSISIQASALESSTPDIQPTEGLSSSSDSVDSTTE